MQYIGKIIYNKPIIEGGELYEMAFSQKDAAKNILPGQFVHIKCGEKTLRRPISIYEVDGDIIKICYQIKGEGTKIMSEMQNEIDFILCGNNFEHFENKRALLVGGGIGIYPLLEIGKKYGKGTVACFGFRNKALVNKTEEFEKHGISVEIISDDGSTGKKGFVTSLVEEHLKNGDVDIIYSCGPFPMLKGIAALAEKYNVQCFVSMEERMACGIGACLGCVCKTLFVDNEGVVGEKYKRVCKDGPVFDSREIKS